MPLTICFFLALLERAETEMAIGFTARVKRGCVVCSRSRARLRVPVVSPGTFLCQVHAHGCSGAVESHWRREFKLKLSSDQAQAGLFVHAIRTLFGPCTRVVS